MNPPPRTPELSVVILNYNGNQWLPRCLESLRLQTIGERAEIVVADNASSDGSDRIAAATLEGWPNGRFIQHGANLGYCDGNNRAAEAARGSWLFFLNNDTWLEPTCLERLMAEVHARNAQAAAPLVLNWDDDNPQWASAAGYDIMGFASFQVPPRQTVELFMPGGCSYLMERATFQALGGFDRQLFMYSDEFDLSWRVWISGRKAIFVPAARLHHRGAVDVNPQGGGKIVEFRTSDTKRFLANRNGLVVLLKNTQHVLLALVAIQAAGLVCEAAVGLILTRRWSFIRRAYVGAFVEAWRLRGHILRERRRIRSLRRRSDWWMLRFLRARLNRFDEVVRMCRFGLPRVSKR